MYVVECKKVLMELQDEARSHGVNDLEAAFRSLNEGDLSEHAELSTKAQYVEVLLKLRSHSTIAKEKAVLPLLLPGSAGANAFQKSHTTKTRLKLENTLERLAVALDLPLDVEWDENCEDYQEGFHELATFIIAKYQRRIEEQVFKRKILLTDLEQSDSGKNSQKLRKSLRATKKNIEDLLSVRETWIAAKDRRTERIISDSFVREVCTGYFPWAVENSIGNGTPVAQRHFAQRYRSATCQLKRSEEESVFLRLEIMRLYNWVEERNSELQSELTDKQQRLTALQDVLSAQLQLPSPEKSRLEDEIYWLLGRIKLLKRDVIWNTLILQDAKDRLSVFLVND